MYESMYYKNGACVAGRSGKNRSKIDTMWEQPDYKELQPLQWSIFRSAQYGQEWEELSETNAKKAINFKNDVQGGLAYISYPILNLPLAP